MKNLFWWHVMILMNKPHFCSILEKYDGIFHANKEVKLLTVSWLIWWCFVVRSLLFVSFAYSVIQNDLTWPGIFCIFITFILFFFKTCQTLWPLKNILFQSFTLFCQTLELRLPQDNTNQSKIILNEHVRWKKFPFDHCTSLNTLMNLGGWIIQHL